MSGDLTRLPHTIFITVGPESLRGGAGTSGEGNSVPQPPSTSTCPTNVLGGGDFTKGKRTSWSKKKSVRCQGIQEKEKVTSLDRRPREFLFLLARGNLAWSEIKKKKEAGRGEVRGKRSAFSPRKNGSKFIAGRKKTKLRK